MDQKWEPNPQLEEPYKAILRRIQMLLEEEIKPNTGLAGAMAIRYSSARLIELCLTLAECELEPQESHEACVDIDSMQFGSWEKHPVIQRTIATSGFNPIEKLRTLLRSRWQEAIAS